MDRTTFVERNGVPHNSTITLKLENDSDISFEIQNPHVKLDVVSAGRVTILSFSENRTVMNSKLGYTESNADVDIPARTSESISFEHPLPTWVEEGWRMDLYALFIVQKSVPKYHHEEVWVDAIESND